MFKNECLLIVIAAVICSAVHGNARAEDKDPFVSIIDLQKQQAEGEEQIKLDLSNVMLKGIIWSNDKGLAVINEDMVAAGESWGEFKVERVDKKSVTLQYKGKEYQLFLEESSGTDKKTPPPGKVEPPAPPEEESLKYLPDENVPGGQNEFNPDMNLPDENLNEKLYMEGEQPR